MYTCVRVIDFASFCDFSIGFWNCSDNVVFLGFSFYQHTFLFVRNFIKTKATNNL